MTIQDEMVARIAEARAAKERAIASAREQFERVCSIMRAAVACLPSTTTIEESADHCMIRSRGPDYYPQYPVVASIHRGNTAEACVYVDIAGEDGRFFTSDADRMWLVSRIVHVLHREIDRDTGQPYTTPPEPPPEPLKRRCTFKRIRAAAVLGLGIVGEHSLLYHDEIPEQWQHHTHIKLTLLKWLWNFDYYGKPRVR